MSQNANIDKGKHIICMLNKLFKCDYNVSSFDAICGNKLLSIIIKIFKEFGIVTAEFEQANASLSILNALNALKYVPESEIDPVDFRNGLVTASKDIVYPILTFLLENKEDIKKRFYLSKYVSRVEVPLDVLKHDVKLQILHQTYNELIDKFWLAYSENVREEVALKETRELQDDIIHIKTELKNLERLIDTQSKKVAFPNNVLQRIRYIVDERKKHKKLSEQIEADKIDLQQKIDTIRCYQNHCKISSLDDLLEKSEHYASVEQSYEISLKEISNDLLITEEVDNSSGSDDLQPLQEERSTLQECVNKLNQEIKQDTSVSAMQNHEKVFTKKKAILTKQIIKIKLQNDLIVNKNEELIRILEGGVLQGKMYHIYINDLGAMSKVYKEKNLNMKCLKYEEAVLHKTLNEVHNLEHDVQYKTRQSNIYMPDEIKKFSLDEIKAKTYTLQKQYNLILRLSHEDECKYQTVKDMYRTKLIEADNVKQAFEEATENLINFTENLENDIKTIKDYLEIETNDFKLQEREMEYLQESLFRYSQMFIDNAGDLSSQEVLQQKLAQAQEKTSNLRNQDNENQQLLNMEKKRIQMTQGVITLIKGGKLQVQ